MSVFSRDTSPEMAKILVEGYRHMTPEAKFARVVDLSRTAQVFAAAGMRSRHPEACDREIQLRVAALSIDRDTMIRAFGWDPDEHR